MILFGVPAGTSTVLATTCEAISTAFQTDQSWYSPIVTGVVAGIFAAVALGTLRWLRAITFTRHDRSALIYLGTSDYFEDREIDVKTLANYPIYPDNQRRYQLGNDLYTNNDPRDVVGFIVGEPRFLEHPPHDGKSGYYAYVVINWQYAEQFSQWAKRGFAIQLTVIPPNANDPKDIPQDDDHLLISPSVRDFSNKSEIWDVCDGMWYSFKWQPYKKWGFTTPDLKNRSRSWQSTLLMNTAGGIKWPR